MLSAFLYSSEFWALTQTLEDKIDGFQRKLLHNILNIHRPKTINNQNLYKITKTDTLWSTQIKKRRLSRLGHLMRLPEETPARKAQQEVLKPEKRKRGRPTLTWWQTIKKTQALT